MGGKGRRAIRRWGRRARSAISSALSHPIALFLATFALIFIPASYTIFDSIKAPWLPPLEWIAIGAVAVATATAQFAAAKQFRRIVHLIRPIEDRSEADRDRAAALCLSGILDNPPPALADFQFRVYMFDADEKGLVARWSPEGESAETVWPVGKGVVGHCYKDEEMKTAKGAQCSQGFNVPPEWAERYKDLTYVIAVPCMNARKHVNAVLAASTTSPAAVDTRVVPLLRDMATATSRVLIDVLRIVED